VKILKLRIRRPEAIVSQTTHSRHRVSGYSPPPWARHALTLLAVLWLNVAVQPCAMAMVPDSGVGDQVVVGTDGPDSGAPVAHHCPHCPPAQLRAVPDRSETTDPSSPAMNGHQGHGASIPGSDSADEALSASTSCLDTFSDCGDFGRMATDGRGADLKVKPSPELVYLAPAWPAVVVQRATELPPRWRTLSYLPGPPPALNCLHCVYLK